MCPLITSLKIFTVLDRIWRPKMRKSIFLVFDKYRMSINVSIFGLNTSVACELTLLILNTCPHQHEIKSIVENLLYPKETKGGKHATAVRKKVVEFFIMCIFKRFKGLITFKIWNATIDYMKRWKIYFLWHRLWNRLKNSNVPKPPNSFYRQKFSERKICIVQSTKHLALYRS